MYLLCAAAYVSTVREQKAIWFMRLFIFGRMCARAWARQLIGLLFILADNIPGHCVQVCGVCMCVALVHEGCAPKSQ